MSGKKNQGKDFATLLIVSAAIVTVVRYAAAFYASDAGEITGEISLIMSTAIGFSGIGMGLLDVFGGLYLFEGWRRSMPASGKPWGFRFKVLSAFVLALMVTGVLILVPFTVARVSHKGMAEVLTGPWLVWWAVLVNVAPYLLIGGVATGNKITTESYPGKPESSPEVSDSEGKLSGNFPQDWRAARRSMRIEDVAGIAKMTTAAIQKKYHLKQEKTARNWRIYAQKEVETYKVGQGSEAKVK